MRRLAARLFQFLGDRALSIAAAVAFWCAIMVLILGVRIAFSDTANIRGVEPNVIFTIEKTLTGRGLYTRPAQIPFDIAQYGPNYYGFTADLVKALDLQVGDVYHATVAMRLCSFFFNALVLVNVFFWLRQLGVRGSLATIAVSLVLASQAPWNFLARPDGLASWWTFVGVFWAHRSLKEEQRTRGSSAGAFLGAAAAAGFGVLAVLTKQSGIQVPAILLSYFLFTRDWRRLAAAGLTTVAVLSGFVIFLYVLFGPALKENVIDGLRNGYDLHNMFTNVLRPLFFELNFGVVIAGCAVAVVAWFRRGAKPQEKFLAYALVFMFAFATLTAVKRGSAVVYYNDFIAVACVSVAYFLNTQLGGVRRGPHIGHPERSEGSGTSEAPSESEILRFAQNDEAGENDVGKGSQVLPQSTGVPAIDRRRGRLLEWLVAAYVILWLPILTFSLIAKYDNPGDRISTRRPVARSVWETLKPYPDAYFFTTDTTLANFLPSRAVVPQHFLAAIAYDTGMVNYDRLQELINSGRVRLCVVGSGQDPSRQLGFLGVKADCYVRVRTEGLYSLWEFSPTSPGKKAATSAPQANEHIAAASSAR